MLFHGQESGETYRRENTEVLSPTERDGLSIIPSRVVGKNSPFVLVICTKFRTCRSLGLRSITRENFWKELETKDWKYLRHLRPSWDTKIGACISFTIYK